MYFFTDYRNEFNFDGILNETFDFVENTQLLREDLWNKFVTQFIEKSDSTDAGWMLT